MPPRRRLPLAPQVLLLYALACASLRAEEPRYVAIFDNGERHTGDKVDDWFFADRMPRLNGRNLLDEGNPARVIYDTQSNLAILGAHLELANGDLLPGRVERYEPASASHVATLVVRSPLAGANQTVRVRADAVRRIASSTDKTAFAPGFLESSDGQRVRAERVRFAAQGVRGLTASGTVDFGFVELREAHFDVAEPFLAWRNAIWLDTFEPEQFYFHLHTASGGRLTVPRELARGDIEKASGGASPRFAVQPLWSLDPLYLFHDDIASASQLRLREVPLSLFEPVAVEQRSAISHWPWQANASLQGEPLRVEELVSDLGLATHSYTALTFALPEQAEELFTVVGIDPACRRGGCARASIHRESASGLEIWRSDFLRGGQSPVRVGPLDVRGAKQLTFVTDFAHDGRPTGADPFDIRDFVHWLMPFVRLQPDAWNKFPPREPDQLMPELAGWQIAA
ncbi:MAG: NPCBM/NEW2 domain-containing protein, partial [Planctomycetales bacterium]|nr:NPCBM/NEW2 domain-containing protein [Planctomycetales bacterium]